MTQCIYKNRIYVYRSTAIICPVDRFHPEAKRSTVSIIGGRPDLLPDEKQSVLQFLRIYRAI